MSKTRAEKTETGRLWFAAHPGYYKKRYDANREAMLEWRRAYRKARKAKGLAFPSEGKYDRERSKAYREANKEILKERVKRSIAKKPEYYASLFRESGKRWRRANPEKVKALRDAHRKAHPELTRASYARKRAKRRGAPGQGWTAQDVAAQHSAQHGCCFYCDKKLGKAFHRDHVIPLAKGGRHCRSNMVLACAKCNQTKSAHGPEWAGLLL